MKDEEFEQEEDFQNVHKIYSFYILIRVLQPSEMFKIHLHGNSN